MLNDIARCAGHLVEVIDADGVEQVAPNPECLGCKRRIFTTAAIQWNIEPPEFVDECELRIG